MFAASSDGLLHTALNFVEPLAFNEEKCHQDLDGESRIMKVLAIQSRRAEWFSLDLHVQTNPYRINDWVFLKKRSSSWHSGTDTEADGSMQICSGTTSNMVAAR